MQEPSLRSSRLVIAGGLAAAIAMAAGGFVAGRATSPAPAPREAAPIPAKVVTAPPVAQPRILQREDLIAAAQRAADALAAGKPLPPEVTELAGRRFEFAIPFGCDGPAGADSTAPLRWRYDLAQQTLRIHVARTGWLLAEWGIEDPDPAGLEAEGFWIGRPWTSSEACPLRGSAALAADAPPILPAQTLAIAQFPAKEAVDERPASRPFDLVKRLAPERFDAADGFRVRLVGRVRADAARAPVLCAEQASGDQRPICVISASFEELAVEVGSSGERLGTWSLGRSASASSGD